MGIKHSITLNSVEIDNGIVDNNGVDNAQVDNEDGQQECSYRKGKMRESLRRLASEERVERGVKAGSRRVRVELMDEEHITLDIDRKARGGDLLDKICDTLELVERDYFGLLYVHRGDPRVWLDLNRRLAKTFKNEPWDVRFAVKFYPPEPSDLTDDVTRYQLALAVRRDLIEGRLTCSPITCALLSSYMLQAARGDWDGAVTPSELARHRAAPHGALTDDFDTRVEDLYKKHKGQTPAEAELNYLESAKRLALYGAELHSAIDNQNVPIQLAISHTGISVYRDGVQLARVSWAKLSALCYNKRTYTLRMRAGHCDDCDTLVQFRLASTTLAKKLWRCSVEHHMFFRRESPVCVPRVGALALGARRLSCRRTLRQLRHEPAPTAA